MKLSLGQITKITSGFDRIIPHDGLISFERMKEKTINEFVNSDWIREDYGKKSHANANIMLDFYTDSDTIKISYKNVKIASSRSFWYIDVLVNNNIVSHHGEEFCSNKDGELVVKLYETPARVTIYLPCLYKLDIESIELNDGCYANPIAKPIKFLFYGDSITQGYDVRLPSMSYSAIVGRAFNACVQNLAIGGSFFEPNILSEKYDADFVFVAYGTNDWSHKPFEKINNDSYNFFKRIKELYGHKKVIVLLPLYRLDIHEKKEYSNDFFEVRNKIKENALAFNFDVVDTINWLIKEEHSYSDRHLHPNEFGNIQIANYLINYLKDKYFNIK